MISNPDDWSVTLRAKNQALTAQVDALTAERDRLKQEVDQFRRVNDGLQDAMLAAEADNARLRAELTKAADSLDWADAHLEDAGVVSANVRYGARDARAALTGKKTK